MPGRPTELILMARVARRFYLDGRSKTEIADELGISRFRVARLLDSALRTGVVRIEIDAPGRVDADLSVRLQEAFGLSHAVVIDEASGGSGGAPSGVQSGGPTGGPTGGLTGETTGGLTGGSGNVQGGVPGGASGEAVAELRGHLAAAAAEVLQELVGPDDVLGLAWARSLTGIGNALTGFAPCQVVQLTGALSRPDGSDVLELVRKVARTGGGPAHVFYAPMVVPDAATARALRRQPDVTRAAALVPYVTVAAVGIGGWGPGLSTVFDAMEPGARETARRQGVKAEISGVFVDAEGKAINTPLSKRIIGVTGEQLAGIRTVLAIAYGDAKADAVRSALSGGLVSELVTHATLARRLLSDG